MSKDRDRMERMRLEPSEIVVRDRMRSTINGEAVTRLMVSIEKIGLQVPISVILDGDDAVLVAGRHRLEAVTRLGYGLVDCVVHTDAQQARMWEIAENLHRAELTALERDQHIAEWIRLADSGAGCATKPGAGRHSTGGVREAARQIGIDRDDARRAVKVDGLSDAAKQAARESGLADNRSALLRAASEPSPSAQLASIQREREKIEARKRNAESDRAISYTEAEHFAHWLMERTDINEMPVIVSWLEGTKPRDVIAAMRKASAKQPRSSTLASVSAQ